MKYALGNMLNGAGGLNPDGLSLDLQFAADKTLVARKGPTPVFTRASTATFIGSDGLIQSSAVNSPRFDHDPVTLACNGLLIEESRTNLVFPSDTLSTQTRTVTATPHTLSFYGTGTIVLSGVHVATVVGTGSYPTMTTLTFTPTAGSLTLTVTGSVTQAQLEVGSFPTSYIPTTTASVVRSADLCSITGGAFALVYSESEHTLFAEASAMSHASFGSYLSFDNGTTNEQSTLAGFPSPNTANCYVIDNNSAQTSTSRTITLNQNNKMAAAMKLNSFQIAVNNVQGTQDTGGTMPVANNLKIGRAWNGAIISGTYMQVKVFKKRLPNAKLQTLTTL
jgi:hypothetical protein